MKNNKFKQIFKGKSLTQQNKVLSTQEIFHRALHGLPLNVNVHELYDCDLDDDFDPNLVFSEMSDRLEVMEKAIVENERLVNKLKNRKEVSKNVSQKEENAPPQSTPDE